jgi:O-antigen ligase
MRRPPPVFVVAAVLPLAVLAIDPGGWFPFGPVKWLAISALIPLGAALVWSERPVRARRDLTIASVVLVGSLAVAAAVGQDRLYAWTGTPERHLGVLTWVLLAVALAVGQSLDDERDRGPVLAAVLVTAVGVGALAVAEAAGWEPALLAVTAGRLTGSLGSAAYLGAAGVLLLPVTVAVMLDRERDRRARAIASLATAGLVVAVIGSGARAAWFGLAVAAGATVVARGRRRLRTWRAAVAVGAAGLLVAAALVAFTPVGARLSALTDGDAAGGLSRLDEWRVAARVIAAHPLTGVGPEGYRVAFAEGVDETYERTHGRDPLPDRAHAAPLDVALAGGLVTVAAWAVVVAVMMAAAVRILRTGEGWLVGAAAGLIAHFVGQLLLFPTAELEPAAWLLGGLVVAAGSAAPVRARPVPRPVLALLGLGAVTAAATGVLDVVADRNAAAAVAAAGRTDTGAAVDHARAAVSRRPDEVRLHLLLARTLIADERGTRAALRAVDGALAVSPRDPVARRERARLLVERAAATHLPEDVAAARTDLAALTREDPSNAVLHRLAGQAARLDGDEAAADRAFARAEALSRG